eukprot:1741655-Amphidinium_carterae.1
MFQKEHLDLHLPKIKLEDMVLLPDENSDGEPAAHLQTQDDRIRMLEDRLSRSEIEIGCRDSITAKNQA